MAIESTVDPGSTHALNTGGTRFFSSAEGSYPYKQPTICLNLACQLGFLVWFHFNYLFHMTGLAAL